MGNCLLFVFCWRWYKKWAIIAGKMASNISLPDIMPEFAKEFLSNERISLISRGQGVRYCREGYIPKVRLSWPALLFPHEKTAAAAGGMQWRSCCRNFTPMLSRHEKNVTQDFRQFRCYKVSDLWCNEEHSHLNQAASDVKSIALTGQKTHRQNFLLYLCMPYFP